MGRRTTGGAREQASASDEPRARPRGASRLAWPALLVAAVLVAGCGEDEPTADEVIEEIAEQVADLRGLELDEPVVARVVDDDAFVELLADLGERRTSQVGSRTQEDAEDVLTALRHLEGDLDLDAAMDEAVRAGVVSGVYVPEEGALYLPAGPEPGLDPVERVVAAHEVQHALQDAHVGLDQLLELAIDGDPDEFLALNAVVEGDAVLTQERWSRAHQTPSERAVYLRGGDDEQRDERARTAAQALEALPRYVREQLLFPYTAGAEFVTALYDEGGDEAVDAALADPPRTTAAVLRPQRHLDGFSAEDVSVRAAPGEPWEESTRHTFGAFDAQMLLLDHDLRAAGLAADEWSGGELTAWRDGARIAVAVALSLSDLASADAVCRALDDWYASVETSAGPGRALGSDATVWEGDSDAFARSCDEREVRFAVAPDAATAERLVEP